MSKYFVQKIVITWDIIVEFKFPEMRKRRANETLETQKRVAEIERITQEDDESSKSLVNGTKNIEFQRDSLFQEPWTENTAHSSSKIFKLMEQRIQEAARANLITKAGKQNSATKTDSQKFEIDEIRAGGN